jgi:AcrR family transcriptional regulator
MSSTSYDSPIRAEQQELTRQRIFEAVAEELAQNAPEELSFAAIAARAKIAERTVYRHFPTKEALIEAFWQWWITGPFGVPQDVPVSPDELPAYLARLYAAFDKHEQISRAFVFSRSGREIRSRTRGGRLKMYEASLEPVTRRLGADEKKLVLAVFHTLISISSWQTLRDFRNLSGPEASRAAAWAMRVLLRELRANPKTFKENP